jgi:hypothetical protein
MKISKFLFIGLSMMLAHHLCAQNFQQTITTNSTPRLTSSGWGQTLELSSNDAPATLVFSDYNLGANDAFFIGGLSSSSGGNAYLGFLADTDFDGNTPPVYTMSLIGSNFNNFSIGDARAHHDFYVQGELAVGTFGSAPSATLDVSGDARIRLVPTSTDDFNVVTIDSDGFLHSTTQSSLGGDDLDWVVSGTTSTVPTSLSDDIRTDGLVGIGMNPVSTYTHSGGTLTNVTLSVNGTVYAAGGQFVTSDSRLKNDVTELESSLFKINQINGYSYSFKQNSSFGLNLPSNKQFGVLAQEVQAVMPEAVMQTKDGYLAVNYDMLVPVLIESVQELSKQLETLKAESSTSSLGMEESDNSISTIYPNPASTMITFDLNLQEGSESVSILITDLTGKKVDSRAVNQRGSFSSEYNLSSLTDGIYVYNLIIDGQIIDSKKFIKNSSNID